MTWIDHPLFPMALCVDQSGEVLARAGRTMSTDIPFVAYGIGDRTWSAFGDTLREAQRNFDANYIAPGRRVLRSPA